jgi:hypothetical protein
VLIICSFHSCFLVCSSDSGIYAMMFLEYWTSPRVLLGNMFSQEDIPSIRVKIANELFFHHKNTGMKHRVLDFKLQVSIQNFQF